MKKNKKIQRPLLVFDKVNKNGRLYPSFKDIKISENLFLTTHPDTDNYALTNLGNVIGTVDVHHNKGYDTAFANIKVMNFEHPSHQWKNQIVNLLNSGELVLNPCGTGTVVEKDGVQVITDFTLTSVSLCPKGESSQF